MNFCRFSLEVKARDGYIGREGKRRFKFWQIVGKPGEERRIETGDMVKGESSRMVTPSRISESHVVGLADGSLPNDEFSATTDSYCYLWYATFRQTIRCKLVCIQSPRISNRLPVSVGAE